MSSLSLKYKLLVLTVVALGLWAVAVDLPYTFEAGDVIRASEMNETLEALDEGKQERVTGTCAAGSSIRSIGADGAVACEVDDIGSGSGTAGVDAVNGMTGAVTLQAGDNVSIDDSDPGQIVISASGGGTGTDDHDHFGETWTGEGDGDAGLSVVDTGTDVGGRTALVGRVGAASTSLGLNAVGVLGDVPSGAGVAGTSPTGFGVYGYGPANRGVFGESSTGYGVYGLNASQQNAGVFGGSSAVGVGVHGRTGASTGVVPGFGAGVWGEGGVDSYGVFAHSAGNISLYAQNDERTAIKGQSASSTGVWGDSASGHGVLGHTSGAGQSGVRGETIGSVVGYGVYGASTNGIGVYGESANNAGVFGRSTSNNAAFFTGGSGGAGSCSYNGGAGWNCTSDRDSKENFRSVDPVTVLERLAAMPIHEWTMIGDANATPHLGPTAQDFREAFGLGDSDTSINSADAQGVALAAIQGLFMVVQDQSRQIEALTAELETLREN